MFNIKTRAISVRISGFKQVIVPVAYMSYELMVLLKLVVPVAYTWRGLMDESST